MTSLRLETTALWWIPEPPLLYNQFFLHLHAHYYSSQHARKVGWSCCVSITRKRSISVCSGVCYECWVYVPSFVCVECEVFSSKSCKNEQHWVMQHTGVLLYCLSTVSHQHFVINTNMSSKINLSFLFSQHTTIQYSLFLYFLPTNLLVIPCFPS